MDAELLAFAQNTRRSHERPAGQPDWSMSAAVEDSRLDPANAAADKNLRELEGGRAGESTAASSSSNIDGKGQDHAEGTFETTQQDGLVARIRKSLDGEVDPASVRPARTQIRARAHS